MDWPVSQGGRRGEFIVESWSDRTIWEWLPVTKATPVVTLYEGDRR